MSDGSGDRGALVRRESANLAEQAFEAIRRLILFQSCDEWFALPIAFVREVQPLERVTRVPNAPRDVLGILNIRGRVLTLVGLAECLAIAPGRDPSTHVVVLDLGDPELRIGLAVQRIGGVRRIPMSSVEPPPPRDGGPDCLEGVFEVDGQVVGLLDLSRVFARSLPAWGITLEGRGASEAPTGA
jgi:purine-binding chemotaxis protein CheW